MSRKKQEQLLYLKSDPEIFTETTVYDYGVLSQRLRELAFLNKGLKLVLEDERLDPAKSR